MTKLTYRCESCLKYWEEEKAGLKDEDYNVIFCICEFCANNPSSLEILKHQINNLDTMQVSDFPAIIRRMFKHVILKEED